MGSNKFVLVIVFLCAAMVAVGQASEPGAQSEKLRGLKEVGVFVELVKPPADAQVITRNELQTDIETRLRAAGIKVVTLAKVDKLPEVSFLYLNLTIKKLESVYAFNADFFCLTPAQRLFGRGNLAAWTKASSGIVEEMVQVRAKVADLINLFIKDYVAANAKAQVGRTSGECRPTRALPKPP